MATAPAERSCAARLNHDGEQLSLTIDDVPRSHIWTYDAIDDAWSCDCGASLHLDRYETAAQRDERLAILRSQDVARRLERDG